MLTLYVTPEGFLHRLPAGLKLAGLAVIGAILYGVSSVAATIAMLMLVILCYRLAGKAVWRRIADLKSLAVLMAALFLLQGWLVGWTAAVLIVTRMALLILLANLVTLTTRLDAMTGAIMPLLRPLRLFGLPPERLSFAMALVIRFVPVLMALAARLQDAWHARGGGRARWPLAVPLLVNALRMSDQVAEAVAARGGLAADLPAADRLAGTSLPTTRDKQTESP